MYGVNSSHHLNERRLAQVLDVTRHDDIDLSLQATTDRATVFIDWNGQAPLAQAHVSCLANESEETMMLFKDGKLRPECSRRFEPPKDVSPTPLASAINLTSFP